MKIAVQASDLDHARIDGTRVYLMEMLKRFGILSPEENFLLYHAEKFNSQLEPPKLSNYEERGVPFPWAWMQTRFAWELFREQPDKLFLPIQAAPLFMPSGIEVTATIHDLAWKRYPETFSPKTRFKLDVLLRRVLLRAQKLIAVSQSTKNDILTYFPALNPEKIRVIHHGFDATFFGKKLSRDDISRTLTTFDLEQAGYILYVGALQPRKNLVRLIQAFELSKKTHPDMKLMLVGEPAWLSGEILEAAHKSEYSQDIILVGRVTFEELRAWYQGARFFAFPSLYEGFGIPLLEAFASGIPVLTAHNSSLPEVAGDAALYVDAENAEDMAVKLSRLWEDKVLQSNLIEKGNIRLKSFSWDVCAEETMRIILQ